MIRWVALAPALFAFSASAAAPAAVDPAVEARRAIEAVYWSHRVWPADNASPKPTLSQVLPDAVILERVDAARRKSIALAVHRGRPLEAFELQGELDRMARSTRDPGMLQEIFDAAERDPSLLIEALVRPVLVDRLLREAYEAERGNTVPFDVWWIGLSAGASPLNETPKGYTLPSVPDPSCTPGTWAPTCCSNGAPVPTVSPVAVWSGTEMLVWTGGSTGGGRYDPATNTWSPLSTINQPSTRDFATAVWTGNEMIVWGGTAGGSADTTGGRYNPTTDSWTATSTGAGVPSPRYLHTAVWTGSRMIIWGGQDSDRRNTGARYDPATDTWSPTSVGMATPVPRSSHSAVWTGTRMIVWGGFTTDFSNSGGIYDPHSDSWQKMTSQGAPTFRDLHTAVWTGSRMVIWGGTGIGGPVNTGGVYDPVHDQWTPTGTGERTPEARHSHQAVWTGNLMVVWGGVAATYLTLSSGGRYDPVSDKWSTTTDTGTPEGRSTFAAVWSGTHMIVWGGQTPNQGYTKALDTGGRYDPASDSWLPTLVSVVGPRRAGHSATWTGAEMLVFGGALADGSAVGDARRYDPATDTWTVASTANAPAPRGGHTDVWTGDRVVIWGGVVSGSVTATGARYDPTADAWTATASAGAPSPRTQHTAVWTGASMIVWGGGSVLGGARYDPAADAWTTVAPYGSAPIFQHSAVWTGSEMIVWGGSTSAGGRYNPSNNTWRTMAAGDPAVGVRNRHTAIWTGQRMIVWGGFAGSTFTNTGGAYDPLTNTWSAVSTAAGVPSPRFGHTATWTGSEMVIWGGQFFSNALSDGARYDPVSNSWTPVIPADGSPSARARHSATWTGTSLVIFGGGNTSSPQYVNTGSRYCVASCAQPSMWYPDFDGDGFGANGVGTLACSAPAGYIALSGDCDDLHANALPGGTEICDGTDNDCNGQVDDGLPPPGISLLVASRSGQTAILSWTSAGGDQFDVIRGSLDRLREFSGSFYGSVQSCLADNTSATTVQDPVDPAPGVGTYYVLREIGCPGIVGSYSDGTEFGPRDYGINESFLGCP